MNIITLSNEKFNALLKALDNFSTVYLKKINGSIYTPASAITSTEGTRYYIINTFAYLHDTSGTYSPSYMLDVGDDTGSLFLSPTSETGLYVPQNIVINEVDMSSSSSGGVV